MRIIFGMPPALLLRLEGAALFFCGMFFGLKYPTFFKDTHLQRV